MTRKGTKELIITRRTFCAVHNVDLDVRPTTNVLKLFIVSKVQWKEIKSSTGVSSTFKMGCVSNI